MQESKGDSRRAEEERGREELFAEVLNACMEEDLSFIPPEREIARTHTFSAEFQERMEELCRTKGRGKQTEPIRKHFRHGIYRAAACVALVLLVGGVSVGGWLLSRQGASGDTASADLAENAAALEEEAIEEESVAESAEVTADAATGGTERSADGEAASAAVFAGGTVYLAETQELASSLEDDLIRTLISTPLLDLDAESVLVTVGNLSEHDVSYDQAIELQVAIDGAWYVVPKKEDAAAASGSVTLEPGMAQDEELLFADYDLDFGAEQYRIVTWVEGTPLCAQFQFETLEEGLEEVLED